MLDKFRTQKIIWDKANNEIFEKVEAHSGDSNGRKLTVQVLNNGMIESLTDCTLSLAWQTKDKAHYGLDAFKTVDIEHGLFEIYYTRGMLSNVGELKASFVLMDGKGRIESKGFTIEVLKSNVDDDAVQSDNSFTALTEALIKVSKYQDEIDNIKTDIINQGNTLISTEQEKLDNLYTEKESKLDTLHQDKLNALNSLHNTKKAELDALEQDYADKATNLETTYAPRLTAVENMEIGGRNLLKNSDFSKNLEGWAVRSTGIASIIEDETYGKVCKIESDTTNLSGINRPHTIGVLTADEIYTLTAMVRADTEMTIGVAIDGTALRDGVVKTIGTSWEKISITKKSNGINTQSRIYSSSVGTFYVAWIKTEKGNKPTDWTPAPEDVQEQIDTHDTHLAEIKTDVDRNTQEFNKRFANVTWDELSIDNALLTNDNVYFPTGTHNLLKKNFSSKNHYKIIGEKDSIIKLQDKLEDRYSDGAITFTDSENIEISNVTLEGFEGESGNSEMLIKFYNCKNIVINNIDLITSGGYTFHFQDCDNIIVINSRLGKGSLWFTNSKNIVVNNNTFTNTRYDSVKLTNLSDYARITNNYFNGSQSDAIDTYTSGRYVIIADNQIKNCADYGIQMKTILRDPPYDSGSSDQPEDGYNRRVIVKGNTIENCPIGIVIKFDDLRASADNSPLHYPKFFIVSENIIENCPRAIYLRHCQFINVVNNFILESSEYGIMLSEAFYDVNIIGNNILNSGTNINVVASSSANGKRVNVSNNIINIGDYGIYVRAEDSIIGGNNINNVSSGIRLYYAESNSITNNIITNCVNGGNGYGLTSNRMRNSIMSNNIIKGCDIGVGLTLSNANESLEFNLLGNISINNTTDNDSTVADNTNMRQSNNNFSV